ncbi:MAG: hypothetical protein AMJ88_06270 [Anaerolineae bacterium SM23_ 63]|nr:MAG: hypothetical protein AMJ88_06270 [Anaerolineae bacterium SM23_ 63]
MSRVDRSYDTATTRLLRLRIAGVDDDDLSLVGIKSIKPGKLHRINQLTGSRSGRYNILHRSRGA